MPGSVLIVDDDSVFRALAIRTLLAWGHTPIHEAATVAEALRDVSLLRPDLLLLDIGLPDGDGIDLAEQFAELPWAPLIVLVSTDDEDAYHAAAERVHAAGFVAKENFPIPHTRSLLASR